jgi:hypothetical protein
MYRLRQSSAPHCHVSLGIVQRCHPMLVHQTRASEANQPRNVWEQHQLTTLKAIEPTFCQFCDQWLLQPLAECGYSGLTVGRAILPRLCPFCYHDESLSTYQRITTLNREGHRSTYTINTSSHSTHPPPVPAIHPCAQSLRQ